MNIKNLVKSTPFFGSLLQKKWRDYLLQKKSPARLLKKDFKNLKNIFIVQVGSNDGKTGDPFHCLLKKNSEWKALFIEPVPFLFERLKKNYSSGSNYIFENVAIGLHNEDKDFFYVDAKAKLHLQGLPEWFDQLGSFNKDHITKHFGDKINDYIITAKVTVVPLGVILESNCIETINILHIDTEGYDWLVLQQLDLNKYLPKVILFEHKHLSNEIKQKAINYLQSKYEIINLGYDFYCRKLL